LGKEVFIGALYSESLSNNADALMNTTQPMRMELKIVAPDGLTTRRFSRMWIEGMAVNSKAEALTAQADNMVKFDGMFKGRFVKDDIISFSNNPGKGVDIAVNGVVLGNIKDNAFFSMLLSTWIGKIPLSSDYRDSLLKVGAVNAGLNSRFAAISPTPTRTAEVKAWTGAQASSAKSSAPAKVAEVAAVAAVADKPAVETPAAKPAAVAAAAKPATPPPAKVDDEDDGPALTAQSLLARQFYVSDAIKKIRGKTKYPQRALDREQAGNVRVSVVIDRSGNIVGSNLLESSQFDLLNKEALDAVKRSAPFPALPAEIAGGQFEFTVPIRWTLPE
jgi:protein TonB